MRLIFIAGANSIHSLRWIKFFSTKKDINIHWITIKKPNHETLKEFNLIKKKANIYFLFEIKYLIPILNLLCSRNSSILHIHYLGWHSLLAVFASKNIKIVLTPWGSDILKKGNFIKYLWLRYLVKKSHFIICDSLRLKSKIISLGKLEDKIEITMFGVDTDLYKKSYPIFSRKKIFIGSNRKFERIYDIKTLLYAAKELCKFSSNINFLIAGDGSQKEEFIKFVNDNKLCTQIKFLGLLNKEEMLKFYNSIDIFISTSLSDGGLSSSVAEAMSFERLVFVANNSDNKNWIIDGVNGFLFENKNFSQLVSLIKNNFKNIEENRKFGTLSRNIILEKYSYKREMMKVESIYRNLIKIKKTNYSK